MRVADLVQDMDSQFRVAFSKEGCDENTHVAGNNVCADFLALGELCY